MSKGFLLELNTLKLITPVTRKLGLGLKSFSLSLLTFFSEELIFFNSFENEPIHPAATDQQENLLLHKRTQVYGKINCQDIMISIYKWYKQHKRAETHFLAGDR